MEHIPLFYHVILVILTPSAPRRAPTPLAAPAAGQLRSDEGSDISSAASDAGALGGAASPRHQASVSSAGGGGGGGGGGGPADGAVLISELWERKEECERLREDVDTIKATLQQEITLLSQALQEERFRYDRLEQQMNDFIELHQNEVGAWRGGGVPQ